MGRIAEGRMQQFGVRTEVRKHDRIDSSEARWRGKADAKPGSLVEERASRPCALQFRDASSGLAPENRMFQ